VVAEDARHRGVAIELQDVPLPPPVMTTTNPLAENKSVGFMGEVISMIVVMMC
jgi:hypothetical protein